MHPITSSCGEYTQHIHRTVGRVAVRMHSLWIHLLYAPYDASRPPPQRAHRGLPQVPIQGCIRITSAHSPRARAYKGYLSYRCAERRRTPLRRPRRLSADPPPPPTGYVSKATVYGWRWVKGCLCFHWSIPHGMSCLLYPTAHTRQRGRENTLHKDIGTLHT